MGSHKWSYEGLGVRVQGLGLLATLERVEDLE